MREATPIYGDATEAPASEGRTDDLGIPDGAAVHALLKELQATGNELRLGFFDALIQMRDGRLYHELGYASVQHYADRELGLARSTVQEYLRAGAALDELPRLRVLFARGELSWQQVRAITRVARAETELQWLELAWEVPVHDLLVEVREAQRTGRDSPRQQRHGLPNLITRICIDLTLEEKQRLQAALTRVAERLGGGDADREPGTGADEVGQDSRPLLLRWADGILSGAIPAGPPTASESDRPTRAHTQTPAQTPARAAQTRAQTRAKIPAQTIVYHCCTECRQATVETDDGLVQVGPERIAQLAPQSNRVVIHAHEEVEPGLQAATSDRVAGERGADDRVTNDAVVGDRVTGNRTAGESMAGDRVAIGHVAVDAPNSPRLVRQVLHRDGLRCNNPGCGNRRNLQAHHIVYRAQGGPTALANEITVCDRCHALIHAGLLDVSGSPGRGMIWKPRPLSAAARLRDAQALSARARALISTGTRLRNPVRQTLKAVSTAVDNPPRMSAPTTGARMSTAVDNPPPMAAPWSDTRMSTAVDTGADHLRVLAAALTKLGYSRTESERRVQAAATDLATVGVPVGDAEVIRRALRAL